TWRRQPLHARARPHRRRSAKLSFGKAGRRALAGQGRIARLGRFLAALVRSGGYSAAGNGRWRAHAQARRGGARYFGMISACLGISTLTLRFSAILGLVPVSRALANSNAATAELAGPSHISARSGSIFITSRFGSSGPPGHQTCCSSFHSAFARSGSRLTNAFPVMER